MAKSARASRIKKNNQILKKKVFGPAEAARNERLSAKLLELAGQPKPSLPVPVDMEVERGGETRRVLYEHHSSNAEAAEPKDNAENDEAEDEAAAEEEEEDDVEMDDTASSTRKNARKSSSSSTTAARTPRSTNSLKREKVHKAARIEKKRHRKPRNTITFAKHPKKATGGPGKRK